MLKSPSAIETFGRLRMFGLRVSALLFSNGQLPAQKGFTTLIHYRLNNDQAYISDRPPFRSSTAPLNLMLRR